MMFDRILKTVKSLIEKHGLLHPREMAERCGLLVLEIPYRRLHGISFFLAGLRVIAVDSSLPPYRKNGTLFHEITHQILHPGMTRFFIETIPTKRPARYELEADLGGLIYALMWDRQGFVDCGYNVYRFAELYGFCRAAADLVISNLETRGPELLRIMGYEVPDPEDWVP